MIPNVREVLQSKFCYVRSSVNAFWIEKNAKFLRSDNEDISDCADRQADLNTR